MFFFVVTGVLILGRDDVAIEVSLLRSRRPRQEVRCCDRAWTWEKNFMWRQSIYVATTFGQDKRVSCHDKVFCVATRCGQDQGTLCCDKAICVVTKFGCG